MGCAAHADQADFGDGGIGVDGEDGADFDGIGGERVDDGAGGEASSGVEQIRRGPDLSIIVVGGAATAESTTAVHNGAVEHKQTGGVIVARDRDGSHLGKGIGRGVEELWSELAGIITERYSIRLTADDEDRAIGKDDTISKGTCIVHVSDGLNAGGLTWRREGYNVSIRSSLAVLIGWRAANGQDFPSHDVVHDGIATHAVTVASTSPCTRLRATAGGAKPIHGFGWPGVEHIVLTPRKQPRVVISAVDTLCIARQDGRNGTTRQQRP